jgi:transcriptional regulator with XRE-family HTH domain
MTSPETRKEVCPACGRTTTTSIADTVVARAIFERRKKLVLTLQQAAEAVGLSPSTLCRIEHGKLPDLPSAIKLSAWLDMTMDELFVPGRERSAALRPGTGSSSRRQEHDRPGTGARRG